jgi:hypothetical protein
MIPDRANKAFFFSSSCCCCCSALFLHAVHTVHCNGPTRILSSVPLIQHTCTLFSFDIPMPSWTPLIIDPRLSGIMANPYQPSALPQHSVFFWLVGALVYSFKRQDCIICPKLLTPLLISRTKSGSRVIDPPPVHGTMAGCFEDDHVKESNSTSSSCSGRGVG